MKASALAYRNLLRAEVHREAEIVSSGVDGFKVTVPCDHCGKDVDGFHMRSKLPPEQIRKKMQNAGWTFNGGKRAVCPHHQQRVAPPVANDEAPMTEVKDAPVESATDKAKRARRETIMLLDEVFDASIGRYRKGETDASVASVTGLSPEAVAKLREEFYAPLAPDPVPPEVKAALKELEGLQRHADGLLEEAGRMQTRINTVGERIDQLIKRNGWRD